MIHKKIILIRGLLFLVYITPSFAIQEQKRGILSHIPTEKSLPSQTNLPTAPSLSKKNEPPVSLKQKPVPLAEKKLKENILTSVMPTPPPVKITPVQQKKEQEPEILPEETKDPEEATKKTEDEIKVLEKAKQEIVDEQKVTFYFEDATLKNLVKYMETLFNITFLPDDVVEPVLQGNGVLKGHKISFKTNRSLTREEAWDVFVRILDLSGLSLVPGATSDVYRITSSTAANKDALPLYVGTDPEKLPDNAEKIRYIYFVRNSSLATVQSIISALASVTAKINSFSDLDAIIITDKSINIKSLMKIIHEFDDSPPEAMSVIKLKTTDATTVAKLYQDLTATQTTGANRYFGQKKQPQSMYFPTDARIIPEVRTNSLILIGKKAALQKIEDFIIKNIDIELDIPYSPLHIYSLQYTNAEKITNILQQVVVFGQGTIAQQGGVIDGQEYFDRDVKIIPEPVGNNLIIKAEESDYKKLESIIKQLDVLQPQVAIEVMIIDLSSTNTKNLGSQIHNKSDGSLIKNVNMQTAHSGNPIQLNGTSSLLGNLVSLATGTPGTTSLTIGNAVNGVWGVFNILSTHAETTILSNPFLLTTNNYAASFTYGSTKQVQNATVNTNESYTPVTASLAISITPQININNEISMDIVIDNSEFTGVTAGAAAGNTTTKKITTSASVKNREVLALGGITRNKIVKTFSKTPLLGDIPILGQFFKRTNKVYTRSNLLIFISPRIIETKSEDSSIDFYTQRKAEQVRKRSIESNKYTKNDPIDKGFFETSKDKFIDSIDSFMDADAFDNGYKKTQKQIRSHRKKELKVAKNLPQKNPQLKRSRQRIRKNND
ncbi:hypothetical protein K9K77_02870 [Candidatus Babeliales bacterium]|nr:hypothetical protein [Candidatus Babeliales bacterium]